MPVINRFAGLRRARAWLLLLLPACAALTGADATPTEDEVKAAFVLNFPKYIEWPPQVFAAPEATIGLTVLGDHKFASALARMTAGRSYQGRSLVVHTAATIEEIGDDCQILFIGAAERRRMPEVLRRLGSRSVLTVGESDEFLDQGGIINLARRERKIRLEINLTAAGATGLRISSKLLGVAEVVKGKSP